MTEPVWINETALILLHGETLAEHGGAEGLRDLGLLQSALSRPRNLYASEGVTDIPTLAACTATGLVRNRPFNDGNKRAGFLAAGLFLALNGRMLAADRVDATRIVYALAENTMTEAELAVWVSRNLLSTL